MSEGVSISDIDKIKPILPSRAKVECFALLGFYPQWEGIKGTKNDWLQKRYYSHNRR